MVSAIWRFHCNFLTGIHFRENGPKSRKSRKFHPATVSALKIYCNKFFRSKGRFNALCIQVIFLSKRYISLIEQPDLISGVHKRSTPNDIQLNLTITFTCVEKTFTLVFNHSRLLSALHVSR